MSRKGYYSPGLRRDLVSRLYFAARELRVPMTILNDRLMEDALNRVAPKSASIQVLHQPVSNEPAVIKIAA